MNAKEIERNEAIEQLKKYVTEGATVYTILRRVSPSGMTRHLDVFVLRENEPYRLTWKVCKALGYSYDRKQEALKISGCGMDMGFAVVYDLGLVLFKKGNALNHRWL